MQAATASFMDECVSHTLGSVTSSAFSKFCAPATSFTNNFSQLHSLFVATCRLQHHSHGAVALLDPKSRPLLQQAECVVHSSKCDTTGWLALCCQTLDEAGRSEEVVGWCVCWKLHLLSSKACTRNPIHVKLQARAPAASQDRLLLAASHAQGACTACTWPHCNGGGSESKGVRTLLRSDAVCLGNCFSHSARNTCMRQQ
jgi:hypothetical protein